MIGVLLGSGLAGVASRLQVRETIPLEKIIPALEGKKAPLGHQRRLLVGSWKGKDVAIFQGRVHHYEGLPIETTVETIRHLKKLGAGTVVLSFAGGAINPKWKAGDFAVLTDQIHGLSANPLRGSTDFIDCSQIYDPEYAKRLLAIAKKKKIRAKAGVYISQDGPSYETPAEIRAMAAMGADICGMSVTAEAIVARSLNMKVVGLGWASNMAAGVKSKDPLSHQEVLDLGKKIGESFGDLLFSFIETL